jgi:hypothetical protein
MIVAICTAFLVGMNVGAWMILTVLALRPQLAEAWRRRR